MNSPRVRSERHSPFFLRMFYVIFVYSTKMKARPWFTDDTNFANYVNGAVAVCLVQIALLNDIYLTVTHITATKYHLSVLLVGFLSIAMFLFDVWWLIYRRAGVSYIRTFGKESKTTQRWLRLSAAITVAVAIGMFFVL